MIYVSEGTMETSARVQNITNFSIACQALLKYYPCSMQLTFSRPDPNLKKKLN